MADEGKHDAAVGGVKLVPMKRVLRKGESGPTTANVHPKEVRNYEEGGWARA